MATREFYQSVVDCKLPSPNRATVIKAQLKVLLITMSAFRKSHHSIRSCEYMDFISVQNLVTSLRYQTVFTSIDMNVFPSDNRKHTRYKGMQKVSQRHCFLLTGNSV